MEKKMTQLRNFGVYKVPGVEHRLFSILTENGTYLLYDSEIRGLPPQFALQSNGLITYWFKGIPICTVEDLIDTGETMVL